MSLKIPDGYYCSEKFTWLSVDLEKRQNFSCCAVAPTQIDLKWIKDNPGQIFNSPHFQEERSTMLSGQPVPGCESVCWKTERSGAVSRRMLMPTQDQKFTTSTVETLSELHIMLGSTCNMTCSYCCKQYSSAWLKDIVDHGPYLDEDRFKINPMDRLLLRISQPEHQKSQGYNFLLEELDKLQITGEIYLTGGETFLYNNLTNIVNRLSQKNHVVIYTGLGVDPRRFVSLLGKIEDPKKTTLIVSAENLEKFYEFNRFGTSWKTFKTNLDEITKQGFEWYFSSTLTNLTLFGFREFTEKYPDRHIKYEFCSDPQFLGVNVLDDKSKEILVDSFLSSEIKFQDEIIKSMSSPVSESLRKNCSKYVLEFAKRRGLNLDIYPKNFISWLHGV